MKKIYSLMIGVLIGGLITGGLVMLFESEVAYSEESSESLGDKWDNLVANGSFEWQDVFGATGLSQNKNGQDLYKLVYKKLVIRPDEDAMEAFAQNYGLSKQEAQDIMDGSVETILQNSNIKGANKKLGGYTFDELDEIVSDLREDFNDIKEVFDLQQEIEVSVTPTEIFANGDTADSGFDLVHDLSLIEQILFLEDTDPTVGGIYEDALDSAYEAPDSGDDDDDIGVEGELRFFGNEDDEEDVEGIPKVSEREDGSRVANIGLGSLNIEAEILEDDICEEENPYEKALDDYEDAGGGSGGSGGDGDGSGDGSGGGSDGDGEGSGDSEGDDEEDSDEGIDPAPADKWGSVFCPPFNDEPSRPPNPPLTSVGQLRQDTADYGETTFSLMLPICLSIELSNQSLASSTSSSDSCIQCEIDELNSILDETLSHSLVPNKVTGNYLESAKCKET